VPFTFKLCHYGSKDHEYLVYFTPHPNFSDIQSDAVEYCQSWGMYSHDTLFDSLDDNDDECYVCIHRPSVHEQIVTIFYSL
jgi:hypothetical protein